MSLYKKMMYPVPYLFFTLLLIAKIHELYPNLLDIKPSEESRDYVENQKQFQLHHLITEQRHPKTWNLSHTIQNNTLEGIKMLLSVDEDISIKFHEMAENIAPLQQMADAIEYAITHGNKIYVYGCGATGRLAKQIESSFWRPFWARMRSQPQWEKICAALPDIENRLIGEMTGADRALISSLEGFEDLQLIGKLQLQDHHIGPDDVVLAVTEGGETSSVIGTILTAWNQCGKSAENGQKLLYFIYNNPDHVLLSLDRSRSVIENPGITKICLNTGPQAITGSTRMQATTSETFVIGIVLEQAIMQLLQPYCSEETLAHLGFDPTLTLKKRLLSFCLIQQAVANVAQQIADLTDLEAAVYAKGGKSTYFAKNALVTVFTDATERAPTFRLFPLDPIGSDKKSWIQVWTCANNATAAWQQFLGRPFRGLKRSYYEGPFTTQINNVYLQRSALKSLENAGNDQQRLYDFSMSCDKCNPCEKDIGVIALLENEMDALLQPESLLVQWLSLLTQARANAGVVIILPHMLSSTDPLLQKIAMLTPQAQIIQLPLPITTKSNLSLDPLQIRQHIGLKMLLNAHSTGIMAKLGRIVGNTMTHVNPGNLKLIGRATFLILSHVNAHLNEPISYEDANALLFEAMDWTKTHQKAGKNAEVGLCIVRILETARTQSKISWETAETILQQHGLEKFLKN